MFRKYLVQPLLPGIGIVLNFQTFGSASEFLNISLFVFSEFSNIQSRGIITMQSRKINIRCIRRLLRRKFLSTIICSYSLPDLVTLICTIDKTNVMRKATMPMAEA
jgi:hypothetical protein